MRHLCFAPCLAACSDQNCWFRISNLKVALKWKNHHIWLMLNQNLCFTINMSPSEQINLYQADSSMIPFSRIFQTLTLLLQNLNYGNDLPTFNLHHKTNACNVSTVNTVCNELTLCVRLYQFQDKILSQGLHLPDLSSAITHAMGWHSWRPIRRSNLVLHYFCTSSFQFPIIWTKDSGTFIPHI